MNRDELIILTEAMAEYVNNYPDDYEGKENAVKLYGRVGRWLEKEGPVK